MEKFARRVEADLGGGDVLVTSGASRSVARSDLNARRLEAVMRINYFSPIRLTLASFRESNGATAAS